MMKFLGLNLAEMCPLLSNSFRGKILSKYYNVFTGGVWTFGERILPPRQVNIDEADLACILVKKSKGEPRISV